MTGPEKRKKKLWEFDPSLYEPGEKPRFSERIVALLRAVGKVALYIGFFSYPLALPIIGIIFGGLAFWLAFGGSVALISVILSRLGYARIFARRDFPFLKSLVALSGGFLCAFSFYLGLFALKWWIFPAIAGIGAVALLIALKRGPR